MQISQLPQSNNFGANDVIAVEINGITYKIPGSVLANALKSIGNAVTGVKGSGESTYRTGNVNITKENLGIQNASVTEAGLMSAEDKTKLDLLKPQVELGASVSDAYSDSTIYTLLKNNANVPPNTMVSFRSNFKYGARFGYCYLYNTDKDYGTIVVFSYSVKPRVINVAGGTTSIMTFATE